ncbi:hypothetical protein ETN89_02710 [Photobacterium damselae subsp. damselae]|uniref:hypothetical protein n=1 Tax=Photobacterium damselae TaxID=38293 RepID=UPI000A2FFCDC|nr:hypothetical protein [Photobacterium damselae]ARR48521.1 hypothetical protein CAY62_02345 [Photobacterium damselae subsp. damselae]QAY34435.1 hypothetical protein ETN89_02710 [Photobacterium damselae subsp. damselae]
MKTEFDREDDGYIYNSRRNIRTAYSLEKGYFSSNGTYLTYLLSVEYLSGSEDWYCTGIRWLICEDDIYSVMENGFKDFPAQCQH